MVRTIACEAEGINGMNVTCIVGQGEGCAPKVYVLLDSFVVGEKIKKIFTIIFFDFVNNRLVAKRGDFGTKSA